MNSIAATQSRVGLLHKFQTHREIIFSIIGGLFLLFAFIADRNEATFVTLVLYLLSYGIAGYSKAKEGLLDLVQNRSLNVEILMIIAALGAASIGYFHEGAILIFIFSLSGALETYSLQKSERDLSKLIQLAPEEAHRYNEDGSLMTIPVDELRIGDRILIKNGERVPADGIVRNGTSAIDESAITGESLPVDKAAGDEVFNGTMNGNGSIIVEVKKDNQDSLFQKMIRLVQEAKSSRPPSQQLIEKIEGPYVMTVLIVVALMLTIPPFIFGTDFEQTFYRAMVLLVVASPCAVVASIMPALLSGISASAKRGVLVKGGIHLEQFAKAKAVAFDKTGTITKGKPVVTDFIVTEGHQEEDILDHLVTVEKQSSHPLAQAIVNYGETRSISGQQTITHTQDVTGHGVKAVINQHEWYIGNLGLMKKMGETDIIPEKIDAKRKVLQNEGKTVMYVGYNGDIVGLIAVKDQIRPEAKALIAELNKKGVKTIMITGDNEQTAQTISKEAGLSEWVSECLPEQKVSEVEKLTKKYDVVAMVGDGVNDAPAIAKAHIGIAMGSGTDVAIETADLVLTNNQLKNIASTFKLSRKLNRIIKQNLIFSVAVILILIVTNFMQQLTLPLGVIGHEGSTILVILNGLRLLKN
ncbi:heavy metal translocating P-type ATPase [Halalkalibacillus sediminis]|nr:heavy metal translocating P-type ATPase [Halalkalibacillus sediminis]